MNANYIVYISNWTNFGGTGGLHAYKMGDNSQLAKTVCLHLPVSAPSSAPRPGPRSISCKSF